MTYYHKENLSQPSPIWEGSVIKPTRPIRSIFLNNRRSDSQKKPAYAKNCFTENPQQNNSPSENFASFFSRASNRPITSSQLPNADYSEGLQMADHSTNNFYKPVLEKYLIEDTFDFVVHTYARPRRLVAIREKVLTKCKIKRTIATPSVRLGIAGWKLCKPKSCSPEISMRKENSFNNKYLQVISKRISC